MLVVCALLLLGVVLGRAGGVIGRSAPLLDALVIRVALPALVIDVLLAADIGPQAVVPVAVAWSVILLLLGAVLLGGRLLGVDRRTVGTLAVVVPLGNTSFLGFAAVPALLGAQALAPAVLYDQLGTFVALVTVAAATAAAHGTAPAATTSDADGAAGRDAWYQQALRFPPFLALLAAVAMRGLMSAGLPLPPSAEGLLTGVTGRLGAVVVPVAMLSLGIRLASAPLPWRRRALAVGLVLRMVLAPAAVLLVAVLVAGSSGSLAWDVAVLQTAMPPMVTAAIVAVDAGLDEPLAVGLAGGGVVVAMASLPLWSLAL